MSRFSRRAFAGLTLAAFVAGCNAVENVKEALPKQNTEDGAARIDARCGGRRRERCRRDHRRDHRSTARASPVRCRVGEQWVAPRGRLIGCNRLVITPRRLSRRRQLDLTQGRIFHEEIERVEQKRPSTQRPRRLRRPSFPSVPAARTALDTRTPPRIFQARAPSSRVPSPLIYYG